MTPPRAPAGSEPQSVSRTHVGLVRELNEDRALERAEARLWAVADGMGGHAAGDVAATVVVKTLEALEDVTPHTIAECLEAANIALREGALEHGHDVIATTVVVLHLSATEAHFLWSGDSRGYLYRGGRLTQITKDHSLVQDYVDQGLITQEEARTHPQSNIVSNAVGVDEVLGLEAKTIPRVEGDVYLLCTDGLNGMLTDKEIAGRLKEPDLADAADALIATALTHGGEDNVTVVLVRM